MSKCERCGVFYEEAESPEAGLCAVCASGEPEAAPLKWGGAMKMVMLSVQSLGVRPGAAIMAFAGVRFDSGGRGEWFYSRVDLRSSLEAGFHIEADALRLWFLNGGSELVNLGAPGGESCFEAFLRFSAWLGRKEPFELWGNGSTFDNDLLRSGFRRMGLREWKHSSDRCYKTLADPMGGGVLRFNCEELPLKDPPEWYAEAAINNALRDAAGQASHAIEVFKKLDLEV